MPPRVARSSLQSADKPAKARSNPRNPKKAAKRALNAFAIAQYENPEKVKISKNRLGEVDPSFQRKRPRDDEEEEENNRPKPRTASVSSDEMEDVEPIKSGPSKATTKPETSAPAAAVDESAQPEADAEPTGVRASMRLFVRNLPYDVKQEDLESEFASYGNVEEVSTTIPSHPPPFQDEHLIGTTDAIAFEVNPGRVF